MGAEKILQTRVVAWARERYAGRLVARKFMGGKYGSNGWPDYDFLVKGKPARIFFIEFKAPGETPTPIQEQRIGELRKLGCEVYVCANADEGKAIIDKEMKR